MHGRQTGAAQPEPSPARTRFPIDDARDRETQSAIEDLMKAVQEQRRRT